MFWDKKEEKNRLPDLPQMKARQNILPLPQEEDNEEIITEKHTLPSFPDSASQKGFSQAAIKDAVNVSPIEEEEIGFGSPNLSNKNFRTVELEEEMPTESKIRVEKTIPYQEPEIKYIRTVPIAPVAQDRSEKFSAHLTRFPDPKRDIFVKIEKFHTAKKSLESINVKLSEVDELLKKIRETKLREEQELVYWEKEMNSIKTRVKEVTENIFEKIE